MKNIKLHASYLKNFMNGQTSVLAKDLDLAQSCIPGEWVTLTYQKEFYLAYVNPTLEKCSCYLVALLTLDQLKKYLSQPEQVVAQSYIQEHLLKAFHYRIKFLNYGTNARMVFGHADYLPGLIIDSYHNGVLVQINTMGMDRFRGLIHHTTEVELQKKAYFLDSVSSRKKEELPVHEIPVGGTLEELEIHEDQLQLKVSKNHWQKVGYYYDHRDNRKKFNAKITELKLSCDKALDLFCYLGSWGISMLQTHHVKQVDFVDQADLSLTLNANLVQLGLKDKGDFYRADVFAYLDNKIKEQSFYDVVVSDPPPFAKTLDKKRQAIDGYKKLHRKVLSVVASGGIVGFASCTHYVSLLEFEQTIQEAATLTQRKLRLLDIGMQALDHPFGNFNDKSNYIKFLMYMVE